MAVQKAVLIQQTLFSVAECVMCMACNFAIPCTALPYTAITCWLSHLSGFRGAMGLFLRLGLYHHKCSSSKDKRHTVNKIYLIISTFVGLCLSSEKGNKKPLS